MTKVKKKDHIAEFGDFQTPSDLARRACGVLARLGIRPASVVEPTCGLGSFLFASLDTFTSIKTALGLEINPDYVSTARAVAKERTDKCGVRFVEGDFFGADWPKLLKDLPSPMLVIGNPPWVTNAQLGVLGSNNLPEKTNFQGFSGLEALTGKSNFDISEWMLINILHWLNGQDAVMAMLCKTAVARKILTYAGKQKIHLSKSEIYRIDAAESFGASVDACLFVCHFATSRRSLDTAVYESLMAKRPTQTIGIRVGKVVADVALHEKWKHLMGTSCYKWRSGIKHDCAKVMEFTKDAEGYCNGFGERVSLEDEYLFPMLKSSDVANGSPVVPKRWMLVTQRAVRDDTTVIRDKAPKTWAYLEKYAAYLDQRGSSIYRNRARFSVFGVGEYSFAPWKVAISGFYKKLEFKVIGSLRGKPMVLDDTVYFLPCASEDEARHLLSLLQSSAAQEFFKAFIFWDAKRPITIEILNALDLEELAGVLGLQQTFKQFSGYRETARLEAKVDPAQIQLFA